MLKIHILKNILIQYKPFFAFLLKFLLFYAVFAFLYKMYLNKYDAATNEVDYFTKVVANQTIDLLNLVVGEAKKLPHQTESSIKVFFKDKYLARVVEGCNAVSVMILFAAFIFAFSNRWVKTGLYIVLGILIIHALNILRIALLTSALYYYPVYEELLHGTIFPLFIYGVVFLLWILWITKFSGYVKRN